MPIFLFPNFNSYWFCKKDSKGIYPIIGTLGSAAVVMEVLQFV